MLPSCDFSIFYKVRASNVYIVYALMDLMDLMDQMQCNTGSFRRKLSLRRPKSLSR